MLIKICGLTDAKTAYQTALTGVSYIGLLFSKLSARQISLDLAKEITIDARKGGSEVVAVFVDEDLQTMLTIIQELDIKVVQLHGKLPREMCHLLPRELSIIYVVDQHPLPSCLDTSKDFLLFEKMEPYPSAFRFFIAGGLSHENVASKIEQYNPHGVDLSSGVESRLAIKDIGRIQQFVHTVRPGRFGPFGGCYIPELLVQPLKELTGAFETCIKNPEFEAELLGYLMNYAGRPTMLTEVTRFAKELGDLRVFLKREDMLHTGAHKINNAIGQCLLAKHMGKTRIIAETGAGQHGVATATACAMFGLDCVIYMGEVDIERQAPNVAKMRLLGAHVESVKNGSATLKDAVNEALRDWAESYETTHYCLGSALGPHPFPKMVAAFQEVIGREAKKQFVDRVGRLPDYAIACVGGGSNAIGLFSSFIEDPSVKLIGVEAGGSGPTLGAHAARFQGGTPGVLHGSYTYLLQNDEGQIVDTHSISAGLDYPAVGPQHAALYTTKRGHYDIATDQEALEAFQLLAKTEGIIPALESAHALGYLMRVAKTLPKGSTVLLNLSGRGDKDLPKLFEKELAHVAYR